MEFLKGISKGAISHYQLEGYELGEASLQSMDLLKRQNDRYFIRATQGVFGLKRNVLSQYFRVCTELSTKIKSKEFKAVY